MLHPAEQIPDISTPRKKPRTAEDFLRFCDVVLAYTNYPHAFDDDEGVCYEERKIESPLNSIGESANVSGTSDSSSQISSLNGAEESDEDTWGMVTCWCGKPFAGRPMIECESCLVWLHLSCARVRKSNIPKNFKCARCKPKPRKMRQISESASGGYNNHTFAVASDVSPDRLHSRGDSKLDMKINSSSSMRDRVTEVITPTDAVDSVTKNDKSASSKKVTGSDRNSPSGVPQPAENDSAVRSRRRLKLLSPKVPYRGDRKYIVFDHSEPSSASSSLSSSSGSSSDNHRRKRPLDTPEEAVAPKSSLFASAEPGNL